jgi:hypothetical protein
VENVFPIGQKRQKLFPPKKIVTKSFWRKRFFQNYNYKKIFKILENIILDFSFSKKQ